MKKKTLTQENFLIILQNNNKGKAKKEKLFIYLKSTLFTVTNIVF